MRNYFITENGKKVCPVCGKEFYPDDCELYAYKMAVSVNGVSSLHYFCRYNHMRLYQKEYEARKRRDRAKNVEKQRVRRKAKLDDRR